MNGGRSEPLLVVRGLTIGFPTTDGVALPADGVGFSLHAGQTLGLVGESGSGKSITLRALLGLVPSPGTILDGEILWRSDDVLRGGPRTQRRLRGREISMVFQDPNACLTPVYTIGAQLVETLRGPGGLGRSAARARARELLERVGIPSAKARMRAYPHELSGGMRQRVMIALAIATRPSLLLADEPTTALDVTVQAQILDLLRDLQAESGMAMVLVSHDFGVINESCDHVAVMYAGRLVETGSRDAVLSAPVHPYTRGLISAMPELEAGLATHGAPIAGRPPSLTELPPGCPFAPRCPSARSDCSEVSMALHDAGPHHRTACPFSIPVRA